MGVAKNGGARYRALQRKYGRRPQHPPTRFNRGFDQTPDIRFHRCRNRRRLFYFFCHGFPCSAFSACAHWRANLSVMCTPPYSNASLAFCDNTGRYFTLAVPVTKQRALPRISGCMSLGRRCDLLHHVRIRSYSRHSARKFALRSDFSKVDRGRSPRSPPQDRRCRPARLIRRTQPSGEG